MHRLLAIAAALSCASPAIAWAADAPAKPLRTLVYDVVYTAHTLHTQKTSGFNGSLGSGMQSGNGSVSGSGIAAVGLDGDHRGTLTVEVIAATPDGGLVVDTSFSGSSVSEKKTRIAIYSDGHITAPPDAPLGPESLHLLPLLARGFFANTTMTSGASWTAPPQPATRGTMTYRVQNLDGTIAIIALDGSVAVSGINGFNELDHGTVSYATDLDDPLSLELTAHIERQLSIDQSLTTDAHLTVKLVSDSFAKK
jgi:hypothetical protein